MLDPDAFHAQEMRRACLEFCAALEAEQHAFPDRAEREELLRNAGLSAAAAGELEQMGEAWS